MNYQRVMVSALFFVCCLGIARQDKDALYFVKAKAKDKFERTRIADLGIAIDGIFSDAVSFVVTKNELKKLRAARVSMEVSKLPERLQDFPAADKEFHNYSEMQKALNDLAAKYPNLVSRFSIGKSIEGRELEGVRISASHTEDSLPTAIFLGCHHAREHLSVEVPLKMAQFLTSNYATNPRIKELLDTREVWVVPMVNPDGAEHDIASGSYRMWRKNRRPNGDGTFGVDLNRNYGGGFFGGPGSSGNTSSDIYHGPKEFSEPETAAVRDFVRLRKKATVLLTFHTYSELVLWPYGHTYSQVPSEIDRRVFETMGKKMASWNHYTPEKASDLYLASGDTTDWAYEELKLFAFTFELSPSSMGGGGFYPGAKAIEPTFQANIEPVLYMIEKAQNPFRVLEEENQDPLGILN